MRSYLQLFKCHWPNISQLPTTRFSKLKVVLNMPILLKYILIMKNIFVIGTIFKNLFLSLKWAINLNSIAAYKYAADIMLTNVF